MSKRKTTRPPNFDSRVEKLNPWDFVRDEKGLPDLIKIGISKIIEREGGRYGSRTFPAFEKGFNIIVGMWMKKEMITIRGNSILLSRGGEFRQRAVKKGSDKKKRDARYNKVIENKKLLINMNSLITRFSRELKKEDSPTKNRSDKVAATISESGWNIIEIL